MVKAVSLLLTFAMVFSLANVGNVEAKAKTGKKKNVVVLYFSATGTTRGAAKRIAKTTKGKLIAIKAQEPYTDDDLDYGDDDSRVTKEHESASSPAQSTVRPQISNLKAIKKAVKKADVVYIGYPIWWHTAPMTVGTFLERYDLSGKYIYPVSQSASMSIPQYEQSVAFIKECAKGAIVDDGIFSKDNNAIRTYIEEKGLH